MKRVGKLENIRKDLHCKAVETNNFKTEDIFYKNGRKIYLQGSAM